MTFISWPARKVVFENAPDGTRKVSLTRNTASSVGNAIKTILKIPSLSSKYPTATSVQKGHKAPTKKYPTASSRVTSFV